MCLWNAKDNSNLDFGVLHGNIVKSVACSKIVKSVACVLIPRPPQSLLLLFQPPTLHHLYFCLNHPYFGNSRSRIFDVGGYRGQRGSQNQILIIFLDFNQMFCVQGTITYLDLFCVTLVWSSMHRCVKQFKIATKILKSPQSSILSTPVIILKDTP